LRGESAGASRLRVIQPFLTTDNRKAAKTPRRKEGQDFPGTVKAVRPIPVVLRGFAALRLCVISLF